LAKPRKQILLYDFDFGSQSTANWLTTKSNFNIYF